MISSQVLIILDEYLNDISHNTKSLLKKEHVTDTELHASNLLSFVDESGEFVSEFRTCLKLVFSQKKIDWFEFSNLEEEGIDVLITLLLTLKWVGITSLDDAIMRKVKKNNDRGY